MRNIKIKRYDISLLRIFATVFVILLHTCNTITNNEEMFVLTSIERSILETIIDLCMWAVPIFVMITGALLLNENKQITYKIILEKYMKRILLTLFMFGMIFSVMEQIAIEKTFKLSMLASAFFAVVSGNTWGHLWYLYMLIGLYAILPVVKIFVNNSSKKEQTYFLIIMFIFSFVIPFVGHFVDFHFGFYIPVTSFGLFYLLLGWYLDKYEIKFNTQIRFIMVLMMFAIIVVLNFNFPQKSIGLMNYDSPIVAFMAMFIFTLFRGIKRKIDKGDRYVSYVERLCFGMYLVHPVFTNFFYKFLGWNPLTVGYFPFSIFGFWIVFVVCSLVSARILYGIIPLQKNIL